MHTEEIAAAILLLLWSIHWFVQSAQEARRLEPRKMKPGSVYQDFTEMMKPRG